MGIAMLACSFLAPSQIFANDNYTVSLVSVVANRTPWEGHYGGLKIMVDDVPQPNKDPIKGDGNALWSFGQKRKRTVDLACFKAQPLGTSFSVQLTAVHKNDNKHIGKVDVTLVEENDEVRLAFEMKHGERVRRLRRRQRTGDDSLWLTRVFPVDGSANYILRFKIERSESQKRDIPSGNRPSGS